jgi:Beta-lactamase enzyme family
MRYIVALLAAAVGVILLAGGALLAAQLLEDDPGDPNELRIAQSTVTPTPSPTPTASPTQSPTPLTIDAAAGLAVARSEIESALVGIEGTWTLAVIDLPSGSELLFNEAQRLYPASAGKIVVAIAVLRKVELGEIDLVPIQDRFEQMLIISSDEAADDMDALVSEDDTQQVFRDAGASQSASFPGWRQGFVTARDLALVRSRPHIFSV